MTLQNRAGLLALTPFALAAWLMASPPQGTQSGDGWPTSGDDTTDAAEAADGEALDALTFARGMEIPVGAARNQDAGKQRTVMIDTYMDWDYGAVTYLGEDGSIAAIPAPKNWEFRHVQIPRASGGGGGMVALCFQPGTGLTFLLDDNGEWSPVKETSDELVVGDYDVTLALDSDRIFAIRFDQFSGRSWTLESDGWSPIAGNLRGWPTANSQAPSGFGDRAK